MKFIGRCRIIKDIDKLRSNDGCNKKVPSKEKMSTEAYKENLETKESGNVEVTDEVTDERQEVTEDILTEEFCNNENIRKLRSFVENKFSLKPENNQLDQKIHFFTVSDNMSQSEFRIFQRCVVTKLAIQDKMPELPSFSNLKSKKVSTSDNKEIEDYVCSDGLEVNLNMEQIDDNSNRAQIDENLTRIQFEENLSREQIEDNLTMEQIGHNFRREEITANLTIEDNMPELPFFSNSESRKVSTAIARFGEGGEEMSNEFTQQNFVMNAILAEGVKPTLAELERFEETPEGLDIEIATADKEEVAHRFSNGDMVEVTEGELQNMQGKVIAIDGSKITIIPMHEDLKDPLEFQSNVLKKYFRQVRFVIFWKIILIFLKLCRVITLE